MAKISKKASLGEARAPPGSGMGRSYRRDLRFLRLPASTTAFPIREQWRLRLRLARARPAQALEKAPDQRGGIGAAARVVLHRGVAATPRVLQSRDFA